MAKKIRFPLDMGYGVQVRTLEELQQNFVLEKVIGYYVDGKLITWLRDRYLDEFADSLENLDRNDSALSKKICEIFEVECLDIALEIDVIEKQNQKISLLKNYTSETKYIEVIDDIAFEQDDIYDLLDMEKNTIYLCGETFSIPISKKGICYIGINNPVVVIASKEWIDFEERNIKFENIQFDEQYQKVNNEHNKENVSQSVPYFDKDDIWVGNCIEFGRINIKEKYGMHRVGVAPLQWFILEVYEDSFLVMLSHDSSFEITIADWDGYDTVEIKRGSGFYFDDRRLTDQWEKCSLRKWLNQQFYEKVFDDKEKQIISTEGVDRIYLLSYRELRDKFDEIIYDCMGRRCTLTRTPLQEAMKDGFVTVSNESKGVLYYQNYERIPKSKLWAFESLYSNPKDVYFTMSETKYDSHKEIAPVMILKR